MTFNANKDKAIAGKSAMVAFDPVKSLSAYQRNEVLDELIKIKGFENFITDSEITEIVVNRPYEIWTEGSSGWIKHIAPDLTLESLEQFASVFANFNNQTINKENPICSGSLPNGQRGQIVQEPACQKDTMSIVIRRPSETRFTLDDYINSGRLNDWIDVSNFIPENTIVTNAVFEKIKKEQEEIEYLNKKLGIPKGINLELFELQMLQAKADRDIDKFIRIGVANKQNFCLIGGTGSGKTTFTKSIVDLVPHETRIITIEDAPELDLPYHDNKVHLFFSDKVSAKSLLKSCMRMKPDRIFLTELRGEESFDYMMALNTGHAGSVTTTHANSCKLAYHRVANLIKQTEIGQKLDYDFILKDVYTTLDVVISLSKTYIKEVAFDPIRKYEIFQTK